MSSHNPDSFNPSRSSWRQRGLSPISHSSYQPINIPHNVNNIPDNVSDPDRALPSIVNTIDDNFAPDPNPDLRFQISPGQLTPSSVSSVGYQVQQSHPLPPQGFRNLPTSVSSNRPASAPTGAPFPSPPPSHHSPYTFPFSHPIPNIPPSTIHNDVTPHPFPADSAHSSHISSSQIRHTISDLRNMIQTLSKSVEDLRTNLTHSRSENTRLLQTISEIQQAQRQSSSQPPDLLSFNDIPAPPPPTPPQDLTASSSPPSQTPSTHTPSSPNLSIPPQSQPRDAPPAPPFNQTHSSYPFQTSHSQTTGLPPVQFVFPSTESIPSSYFAQSHVPPPATPQDHDSLMRAFLSFQEKQASI